MENNNELKEIDIKNRTCYYFDDITKLKDFDLDNIFNRLKIIPKQIGLWQFIQNFDWCKFIAYQVDKVNGFIRVYNGNKCLVLFGDEKYDFIYNRIRHLVGVKTCITYVISHNYAKIKADSYDSLT